MNHRKTCCGRDFTLVVTGQIISLFGNAILRFALPLYLLKQTGSSALFGTVTALALLPMILPFIVTLMLLYGISGTYQPAVQASIPALVPSRGYNRSSVCRVLFIFDMARRIERMEI